VPKVFAHDGQLTVELSAGERFKSAIRHVSVELWRVRFILVDEGERRDKLGTQVEGRTAHTGAFSRRGEKAFVYWPKHTPAIVIQVLDPVWSEFIIGDKDAKEIASALRLEIARAKAE